MAALHEQPERLAARLLYRFGSIGKIAQASDNDLLQSARAGEAWADVLISVRQLMNDGMREKLTRTRIGEDREAFFAYLLMTMQHLREERMLAIFADAQGYVICEEVIAEGSGSHVLLTPRKIFGRALCLDAQRIVLAHNHPSGCSEPSLLDIKHTRHLQRQALELGIIIDDHFVIGARNVTSMKERGLF